MKTRSIFLWLILSFLVANTVHAQSKSGYISLDELMGQMPEVRKADTTMAEYRKALEQQFAAMQQEFNEKGNLLNSKDTLKYTKPQLDLKKKDLTDLLVKLQGFNQEASELMRQKQQTLLTPIHTKAMNAIQAVAKENGYAYIFEKTSLYAYPPSDDLLPLVKAKLGIK